MSELRVSVVKIDDIIEHTNADALELAIIGGWQIVIQKDVFKVGDEVVYFPLDAILPVALSDKMGITKYLSKGRIRAARLRGEPSYGTIAPVQSIAKYQLEIHMDILKENPHDTEHELFNPFNVDEDTNLADILGVEKWEPPCNAMDEEKPHSLFEKYTNIDNMRNFPDIIEEGEEVVITEKIHGSNARFAYIDEEFMVGSHNIRIKEHEHNKYWKVFSNDMKDLLIETVIDGAPVILYGELYGSGIQDLTYGMKNNQRGVRIFDLKVKGNYVDYEVLEQLCGKHNIDLAPVLYRGPFSMEKIMEFSKAKSTLGDNIMEGVVVRPVKERHHHRIGRVVLKYVFDQYLLRKDGTENH